MQQHRGQLVLWLGAVLVLIKGYESTLVQGLQPHVKRVRLHETRSFSGCHVSHVSCPYAQVLRLRGGGEAEEQEALARAQAARDRVLMTAHAGNDGFSSPPTFPDSFSRGPHQYQQGETGSSLFGSAVRSHDKERLPGERSGSGRRAIQGDHARGQGARAGGGKRVSLRAGGDSHGAGRKTVMYEEGAERVDVSGAKRRRQVQPKMETDAAAEGGGREQRGRRANGHGGHAQALRSHPDFRAVDRERQRRSRAEEGEVRRCEVRAGEGVADSDELAKYVKGESLVASSMGLPEIAQELDGLEFVRRVDVSNNSLQALGGVRRLGSLSWLRASSNRLGPSMLAVAGMSTLRVLDVGHNQLENIDGIASCKQLRALIANDNRISHLGGLRALVATRGAAGLVGMGATDTLGAGGRWNNVLESLILSRNCIRDLNPPDLLNEFRALKKVSLSHNNLTRVPLLGNCSELQELRLGYNDLGHVPAHALPRSLQILDLGHNHIAHLTQLKCLSACPDLRNLNLAGNPCARVPPQGYFQDPEMCDAEGGDGAEEELSGPSEDGRVEARDSRAYLKYRTAVLALCPNLKILDGKKLPASMLRAQQHLGGVRRAATLGRKPNDREIFISNMPWSMSEGHVRGFFRELGPRAVRSVQLLRRKAKSSRSAANTLEKDWSGAEDHAANGSARSKGAAFVKLRSAEVARKALLFANRTFIGAASGGGTVVRQACVRMSWRDVHGKPCPGETVPEEACDEDFGLEEEEEKGDERGLSKTERGAQVSRDDVDEVDLEQSGTFDADALEDKKHTGRRGGMTEFEERARTSMGPVPDVRGAVNEVGGEKDLSAGAGSSGQHGLNTRKQYKHETPGGQVLGRGKGKRHENRGHEVQSWDKTGKDNRRVGESKREEEMLVRGEYFGGPKLLSIADDTSLRSIREEWGVGPLKKGGYRKEDADEIRAKEDGPRNGNGFGTAVTSDHAFRQGFNPNAMLLHQEQVLDAKYEPNAHPHALDPNRLLAFLDPRVTVYEKSKPAAARKKGIIGRRRHGAESQGKHRNKVRDQGLPPGQISSRN